LDDKIETLKYIELTSEIDIIEYSDTTPSEIINLNKNFLDCVTAQEWGLARQFIRRIANVYTQRE
jgi:hypothetical protein